MFSYLTQGKTHTQYTQTYVDILMELCGWKFKMLSSPRMILLRKINTVKSRFQHLSLNNFNDSFSSYIGKILFLTKGYTYKMKTSH